MLTIVTEGRVKGGTHSFFLYKKKGKRVARNEEVARALVIQTLTGM